MTPFVGREHESRRCCSIAGATRRRARVRSRCCRARPASASRAFWRRCASRSATSRNRDALSMLAASVNDAFYPVIGPDLARGGFRRAASRRARLDKLEAMIARSGWKRRRSRRYSPRCCRSRRGRYPALEMAPSEQKERTIAALIALFVGLTKRRAGARAAGRRALDRPHLARLVRPARRKGAGPARAARHDVPAGIRRLPGSAAPTSRALAQPLRATPGRGDDRSRTGAGRCPRKCWSRSSRRPTACRCSWRN